MEYEALKQENSELMESYSKQIDEMEAVLANEAEIRDSQSQEIGLLKDRLDNRERQERNRYIGVIREVSEKLSRRRILVSFAVLVIVSILAILASINQAWDFLGLEGKVLGSWYDVFQVTCLFAALIIGVGFFLGDFTMRLFGLGKPIENWLYRDWALREVELISLRRGVSDFLIEYPPRLEGWKVVVDIMRVD